ncbi:MAG: DUF4126 domain-containing protein [Vulcanimicrobiota bacterium]
MDLTPYFPALVMAMAAGIRAFIPMFIVILSFQRGFIPPEMVNPAIVPFLESQLVLNVVGIIAFMELFGSKIEILSHVLDSAYFLIRPIAGIFLVFCFIHTHITEINLIISIVIAAFLTMPMHKFISHLQVETNIKFLKPFIVVQNIMDDFLAAGAAVLGIVIPNMAVLLAPIIIVATVLLFHVAKLKALESEDQRLLKLIQNGDSAALGEREKIQMVLGKRKKELESEKMPARILSQNIISEGEPGAGIRTPVEPLGKPDLIGDSDFTNLMKQAREENPNN